MLRYDEYRLFSSSGTELARSIQACHQVTTRSGHPRGSRLGQLLPVRFPPDRRSHCRDLETMREKTPRAFSGIEHGAWRGNFELRNAKPGTRPKGGSPQDNCEMIMRTSVVDLAFFKSEIRNSKSEMLFPMLYALCSMPITYPLP